MNDEVMTIREMCDAFEVTPRTLRFYEAKELLAPIRLGQRRLYTRRDRARLKLILRGRHFGFSLEDIRQLLDLHDSETLRPTQLPRTIEKARERLAEMQAQRDMLAQLIHELIAEIEWGEAQVARTRSKTG
ncbi:MerR family transcriptional regulator [Phaeovulum vinaykumarii]|uniref:MerR family transcriptional regulator n=1 Tax=Phaeovulum vinaykumarii TaxID=407234 RepID=UPI000BE27B1D|nr:MerR family DNA-binding transcriptional regulator [Phaeovulum vinaykumarii]